MKLGGIKMDKIENKDILNEILRMFEGIPISLCKCGLVQKCMIVILLSQFIAEKAMGIL